jgi:hypothetical protein
MMSVLFVGLALSGGTSIHPKNFGNEQEAKPIEFPKIVEFDRDVHFLTPDGRYAAQEKFAFFIREALSGRILVIDLMGAEVKVGLHIRHTMAAGKDHHKIVMA